MTTEIDTVTEIVAPIVDDLGFELYDVERRSETISITIDTPPGSAGGVDLDTIALATRLISRELDHEDPIPGKYRLEVSSPGLERRLRTPRHFRREVGKDITVRLRGSAVAEGEQRRVDGKLVAADDETATLLLASGDERVIEIAEVEKARTIFEWGPAPKPGKGTPHPQAGERSRSGAGSANQKSSSSRTSTPTSSTKGTKAKQS